MQIRIVTPSECGPAFYVTKSAEDALSLLLRWGQSRCFAGSESIWKMVRGKWVPMFPWTMEA